MSRTIVNPSWGPKVTLTIDDDTGDMSAVVELEGLDPTRDTTADERAQGVTSLDPPTVSVRQRANTYDTHRALIDGAIAAVSGAADATDDAPGGIGPFILLAFRVSTAVRKALREAGEEI